MTGRNSTRDRDLLEFKDSINEQVEALQAAARELLAKQGEANKPVARDIRVEIRISLDQPESPERSPARPVMECYFHTYVGGHMADGAPIYVIERVCLDSVLGIGEA
jgi:hypothetical protein